LQKIGLDLVRGSSTSIPFQDLIKEVHLWANRTSQHESKLKAPQEGECRSQGGEGSAESTGEKESKCTSMGTSACKDPKNYNWISKLRTGKGGTEKAFLQKNTSEQGRNSPLGFGGEAIEKAENMVPQPDGGD